MENSQNLVYFDRKTKQNLVEEIYGDKALRWLYQTPVGKKMSTILSIAVFSKMYGLLQSSRLSKIKIQSFIQKFKIPMDEFVPQKGRDLSDPYDSFNSFFVRQFVDNARSFPKEANYFPAVAEGRYLAFNAPKKNQTFKIKGQIFTIRQLMGEFFDPCFENGSLFIARLCPVDYHRFHFPDNGQVLKQGTVKGSLHSVNPLALMNMKDILATNQRDVCIIETENFGKVAYIEVGAICVGKIVQTYASKPSQVQIKKGQEKGYFLFGGSTVIGILEKSKVKFDEDILLNSEKGLETFLRLGEKFGENGIR